MSCQVLTGDWIEQLRTLPEQSVQCCVTSPPYWGLRNYKTPPQVMDGDPKCEHEWKERTSEQPSQEAMGKETYKLMSVAVWYHTLLTRGESKDPWPVACDITAEAMEALESSGLLRACDELHVGINGLEKDSADYANMLIPQKAILHWHGRCFNENMTIRALHEWSKTHPGWAVLYFHCKGGASHEAGSPYLVGVSAPWRKTMTQLLVHNWRRPMMDILNGADVACCHWMWNMADGTQHIPAGNFLWLNSSFIATLPPFEARERIQQSGLASAESRYEAEVFWGNGRRPNVVQYLPNGGNGVP